jgi:hypothetical protein
LPRCLLRHPTTTTFTFPTETTRTAAESFRYINQSITLSSLISSAFTFTFSELLRPHRPIIASFLEADKADDEQALRLPFFINQSNTTHEFQTRARDCLTIDYPDNLTNW